jgi:nonribosomal peptide synthetase DhbF
MPTEVLRLEPGAGVAPVALTFARRAAGRQRIAARRSLSVTRERARAAAERHGVSVEALLAATASIVLFRYAAPDAIQFSLGEGKTRLLTCKPTGDSTPAALLQQIERGAGGLRSGQDAVVLSFPVSIDSNGFDLVIRFSLEDRASVCVEAPSLEEWIPDAMAGHLDTVLEALAAGSNAPLAELPLLTRPEMRRALVDWNATRRPYRDDATLHQLCEEAAERFAARTALIAGDRHVTYDELNARANRLAHCLIAQGVGPGSLVGIFLERRFSMVVAVLAVLKTGAGYVPLDPSNPPARLALILDDADVDLVLTQATMRPVLDGCAVPTFDVDCEIAPAYPPTNPRLRGSSRGIAYVIYTSGSTGKPKGVVIEHGSVAAFIEWTKRAFSEEELRGVLFASSLGFDVSVFELFAPLCAGGCAILVDNILSLPDAPGRDRVRLVSATASGLSALVNTAPFPVSVRTVMQAGELMHGTLAQALHAQPGVRRVINLCGATEDTVYSVMYEVAREASENPPIGKPFDNHEAYILNERLQVVPAGIPGDLYYAGAGLAREYFNRPDLTRERFIPNPFKTSPYPRLYKSGDICRYRPDGNIEYVSRADDQVKIRGYRVEINEIEAQLAAYPPIAEVAVAARKSNTGDVHLVAYAALTKGADLSMAALRKFAAERLPAYMIPSSLIVLPQLPRSATGKLDRRALPEPKMAAAPVEAAPEGDVESVLSEMCRELLGLESIDADQNFFELGGHSLTALRLLAQIRERFGTTVQLRDFFAAPRISALAQKLSAPASASEMPPALSTREAAASFSQLELWFLEKILPNHSAYNVPIGIRIGGPIDESALARALDALLARHEQLRATFPDRDGSPYVEIHAARSMPLERVDASKAFEELFLEAARRPFDLQSGPLVRATLFKLGTEKHVLLLNVHHIVTDGWSNGILFAELRELYEAFAQNRPVRLSDLRGTYAEHAAAERSEAVRESFERNLAYWTELLRDAHRTELAGDRVRPLSPTLEGGTCRFPLPQATADAVRAFAHSLGTTPSVALLAGYAALISRYTADDDLVIGMPTAGRATTELQGVVGYFVGMAPLRIDTAGDPTYRDLIERTAVAVVEGLDHQPVPMQMLVERLAPQRSDVKNPLFALAYVSQIALESAECAGARFEILQAHTKTAKFDLLFEVTEGRRSIDCAFEYSAELYDAERIEDMARSFVTLLENALGDPESRLSNVAILDRERAAALSAPPTRVLDARADVPVYRRFEEWALKEPDAIALRFRDEQMSYGELDAFSGRVARKLREIGVGPGSNVGICAERSPLLVGAILGVARSGAAYVPLDPRYPAERLAFIAEDAGLKFVLADRSSRTALLEKAAQPLVLEDLLLGETAAEDLPEPQGSDPAYIIYTSGSTGTPKGVVVTNRNVARLFVAAESVYEFRSSDVWTLFHSYAFDFSVWELWGALAHGGTLAIVPAEVARNPSEFRTLVRDAGVTILSQTPSAFYAFVEADRADERPLEELRYVVFGGEPLDVRRILPWFERYGERRPELVNMYGITETTVHATHCRIGQADASRPFGPIGRPLDHVHVSLRDRGGMLVPAGAIGEIYVGGEGVASGYLNQDELTRAHFIPDPSDPSGRARLYRSGDLARRLLDGSYEYVGRNDDQVKVRGFRIEPGEIEAALKSHPLLARAIVLAENEGPEVRLHAYVALCEDAARSPEDLRSHLAGRLPAHMIPSAFYVVPEIPLTENGKLDRRALTAMAEPIGANPEGSQPVTPMERRLAELVGRILRVENIGIDDNFFSLGGHSLLAARLIGSIEAAFPDEIERLRGTDGRSPLLPAFYSDPTIRGLAAALLRARTFEPGAVVQLRAGDSDRQTPLFWLHGMFNGDGLYTWNLIEPLSRRHPVWVVHPPGYDGKSFKADISVLARQQLDLIREKRPHGPYHIGGFCNGALIAYEIARILEAEGEVVDTLFLVSPPTMIPAMGRLLAFSDRIANMLRVRRRRRVAINAYLYSYARRLQLFADAQGNRRWKYVRRAMELGVRKVRRSNQGLSSCVQPRDFSDPDFKNDRYLRAIAQYVPHGYFGTMEIVWGRKRVEFLGDATDGWSQLGKKVGVHYVAGGHFCVVENPEEVGALLQAAMEKRNDPAV